MWRLVQRCPVIVGAGTTTGKDAFGRLLSQRLNLRLSIQAFQIAEPMKKFRLGWLCLYIYNLASSAAYYATVQTSLWSPIKGKRSKQTEHLADSCIYSSYYRRNVSRRDTLGLGATSMNQSKLSLGSLAILGLQPIKPFLGSLVIPCLPLIIGR